MRVAGQHGVKAEVGEDDVRGAFAGFLAVKMQGDRHAGFHGDQRWLVPAFDDDIGALHALFLFGRGALPLCEKEPQRQPGQYGGERDRDDRCE